MRNCTEKIVSAAEIDLLNVLRSVVASARNNETGSTPESRARAKIGCVVTYLLNVALQAFVVVSFHQFRQSRIRRRQFDDISPIAELEQRRFRQISCSEIVALTNLFQLALRTFVRYG